MDWGLIAFIAILGLLVFGVFKFIFRFAWGESIAFGVLTIGISIMFWGIS